MLSETAMQVQHGLPACCEERQWLVMQTIMLVLCAKLTQLVRRTPLQCLPQTFSHLRRLQALDLTDCPLLDSVPIGLGTLSKLTQLWLDR